MYSILRLWIISLVLSSFITGLGSEAYAQKFAGGPSPPLTGSTSWPIAAQNKVFGEGTTLPSRPQQFSSKNAKEMASDLARQANKGSIIAQRPEGKSTRYDLTGRGHHEKSIGEKVHTPHKIQEQKHTGPSGKFSVRPSGLVEPMGKSDVRIARRILGIQNGGK